MDGGRSQGATSPELAPALADPAGVRRVVRAFLDEDGCLQAIPAKHSRRQVLLDRFAGLFEPGERYPENEVNTMVRAVDDDVAALPDRSRDPGSATDPPGAG